MNKKRSCINYKLNFENKFNDLVRFINTTSYRNSNEKVSFLSDIANKLGAIKSQILGFRNELVWKIYNDNNYGDHFYKEIITGEGRINLCNLCINNSSHACTNTVKF